MKVIEWLETDDQYWAVVQPSEIFYPNTFFESDRYEYEAFISGILKEEDEEDIFAHAFDKRWVSFEEAQRWMSVRPAPYTEEETALMV
ncbi:hypothetical protein H8E77_12855 [bacterium]|nr:hypothetical protein [bacterium]